LRTGVTPPSVRAAFLIHKGNHESKDTDDEMMQKLDRILERVEKLEQSEGSTRSASPVTQITAKMEMTLLYPVRRRG
jgi:cell wall assembly regulator SMI1